MAEQKLMRMKKTELVDAIFGLQEENEKIGGLVISQTIKLKDVSIKHNNLVMKLNELKEENKNLRIVMNWSQPPRTISIKEIQES